MSHKGSLIVFTTVVMLAVVSSVAGSAQDKYTLKLPDGVAFSDFRGYEDWRLISSSKTDDRMKTAIGHRDGGERAGLQRGAKPRG